MTLASRLIIAGLLLAFVAAVGRAAPPPPEGNRTVEVMVPDLTGHPCSIPNPYAAGDVWYGTLNEVATEDASEPKQMVLAVRCAVHRPVLSVVSAPNVSAGRCVSNSIIAAAVRFEVQNTGELPLVIDKATVTVTVIPLPPFSPNITWTLLAFAVNKQLPATLQPGDSAPVFAAIQPEFFGATCADITAPSLNATLEVHSNGGVAVVQTPINFTAQ